MENIYNLVAKEIRLDTQKSIITNTNKTLRLYNMILIIRGKIKTLVILQPLCFLLVIIE